MLRGDLVPCRSTNSWPGSDLSPFRVVLPRRQSSGIHQCLSVSFCSCIGSRSRRSLLPLSILGRQSSPRGHQGQAHESLAVVDS